MYDIIGEKQPNICSKHELKREQQQTRNYTTLLIEFDIIADLLQNTQSSQMNENHLTLLYYICLQVHKYTHMDSFVFQIQLIS